MKYFGSFAIWLKQAFRVKRTYSLAAALSVILYGFSILPVFAPGIEEPSPIGAFLNGVFPINAPNGGNQNWELENAFPNLTFIDPLAMLEIPGENAYYVVSKVGLIYKVANDPSATSAEHVLDIRAMVDTDIDTGVANAILHPEFGQAGSPNRGYIYVFYRYNPNGNVDNCDAGAFLRLSRFNRPSGSSKFDPSSEFVLMQIYDEQCFHSGGAMFFDREGYFYLATGDAGGSNDQYQSSQKINERLMSGLLRIDVDRDPGRSHPIRRQQTDPPDMPFSGQSSYQQGYFIPNDNPFLDANGGVLEEFYAIGLRSPHRGSYDEKTGKIWMADVGQGKREEISIVPRGGNMQWPFREGFAAGDFAPPAGLIGTSTAPIYDYDHTIGNSIIGGFVYRGDHYQGALSGNYIFGDHGVRNIWSYNPTNEEVIFLANVPGFGQGDKNGISSFATNSAGEIFVLKLYGTDLDGGVIYKLKQGKDVPEPPRWLSQTSAFTDLKELVPSSGIIPYTVNAPLWSDRALKKRWIALPNDGEHDTPEEQITFSKSGNWQFPAGTVFIKHFELPVNGNNPKVTKKLETRFLVITQNGEAYGVTYVWNNAGTDAELIVNGESKDFSVSNSGGASFTQTWNFPSRTDCMTCHNANTDFVLGVHTWQLNGNLTYPSGITDNQLNTWNHLGMFANPFEPAAISGFLRSVPIDDQSEDLEIRVRSYLDANCAHCHRPDGVEGAFDARFSTPLPDQNLIWAYGASRNTPDDHYIIKPLDPGESEIWVRDNHLGENAMPPLAKELIDENYIEVLTDWINSLEVEACLTRTAATLEWSESENYLGPVEVNQSVGSEQANDGSPITINGQVFNTGLGVHAPSSITYQANGDYARLESYVGVDDATCNSGSVQFEVYADGELVYQSPLITQGDDAQLVSVDITGTAELRLVVTDGGNGASCDHADWADLKFLTCSDCEVGSPCDDGDPCTDNDVLDEQCNCAGTACGDDSDNDGICNLADLCPGFDDALDADQDGVPDGCDRCPGYDDSADSNDNGIPDNCESQGCITTFLTDLEWSGDPQNQIGDIQIDKSHSGVLMRINGQPFERGLGVHAQSEVTYDLGGKYDVFETHIGIDDQACDLGSAVFEIYADDDLVYTSPQVNSGDDAIPVSVEVGGIQKLRLAANIGNGTDYCDHADWAGPKLLYCNDDCGGVPCNGDSNSGNGETPTDILESQNCVLDVTLRPNPFRDEFRMRIKLPLPEMKRATVRIMDTSGRIIYQRFDAPFGRDIVITPHKGWANGLYILQVRAGEYGATRTIVRQ